MEALKNPKEIVDDELAECMEDATVQRYAGDIKSGGGIEFMRPWTEKVYGIPPEQVVGNGTKTKFEMRDGKPVLMRLPEMDFIDDKVNPSSIFRMTVI